MRLAPLLLLAPALAAAQDVPSLQRPNPALPIAEAVTTLSGRLGKPGGTFAAAQLALDGLEGRAALLLATEDADPLRRLDATYGLSSLDDPGAYYILAERLGDPDARVTGEAYTALRRAGPRAFSSLREAGLRGAPTAGEALVQLLPPEIAMEIASTPRASARAAALRRIPYLSGTSTISIAERAMADPRFEVKRAAAYLLVYNSRTTEAKAALARFSRSPDPLVRESVVLAYAETESLRDPSALLRFLTDPSPAVRRSLVGVLWGTLYEPPHARTAFAALSHLVDDPDPSVAALATPRVVEYIVDRQGQAEETSWRTLSSPVVLRFRRGFARGLGGPLRFQAAVGLAAMGDRRAYAILAPIAFASASDATPKTTAIAALGLLGDPRATPGLLKLTEDQSWSQQAFLALGRLRDPASVPPLLARVRRDSMGDGINAAFALTAIGDRRATPPLLAVAKGLGEGWDANYFVPLAQLGGGPEVREYLVERFAHDLPTTVANAERALILLHDPAAIPGLSEIAKANDLRGDAAKRVIEALRRPQPTGSSAASSARSASRSRIGR